MQQTLLEKNGNNVQKVKTLSPNIKIMGNRRKTLDFAVKL
jgi:hypothetical protein